MTDNSTSSKKFWLDPELKKFNKMDLVKSGALSEPLLESGACYKIGS